MLFKLKRRMKNPTYVQHLPDEAATMQCAAMFARYLHPGLIIFLKGELGAGKTTFTRGLLQALGYQGKVKSPTYTLVEPYHFATYDLFHFDLYRIMDANELLQIGIADYFTPHSLCLVEWPAQGGAQLPAPDLICALQYDQGGRKIRITAQSAQGAAIISQLPAQQ